MKEQLPQGEDILRIRLEPIRLCDKEIINNEQAIFSYDVDTYIEKVTKKLMVQINAYVYGQTLDKKEWAATWWDAFKLRWFPAWWLRRHPVKMEAWRAVALYPTIPIGNHKASRIIFLRRNTVNE